MSLNLQATKPYVSKFIIKRILDTDPDLSYLEQYNDYKGNDVTPEEAARYAEEDRKELEAYGTKWWMYGIRAECEFHIPSQDHKHVTCQTLSSGGLWGNHSDMDKSEFAGIEQEELAKLKEFCGILGIEFSDDTPIEHKEE